MPQDLGFTWALGKRDHPPARRGANYDIAPSVLSWLDLPTPGGLPGALLTTGSELPRGFSNSGAGTDELLEARLSYLEDLLTRSAATYRQRSPLLKTFVTLEIIIYLTAFALVVVYPSLPRGWTGFMGFLLLFIASIPLALLILPILRPMTTLIALFYTLVIAVSFTLLTVGLIPKTEHRFGFICALTALGIAADAFLGGSLIKYSPLGYDVMLGARFYGIGNEYMGILVGASILAASAVRGSLAQGRSNCPALVLTGDFHLWLADPRSQCRRHHHCPHLLSLGLWNRKKARPLGSGGAAFGLAGGASLIELVSRQRRGFPCHPGPKDRPSRQLGRN